MSSHINMIPKLCLLIFVVALSCKYVFIHQNIHLYIQLDIHLYIYIYIFIFIYILNVICLLILYQGTTIQFVYGCEYSKWKAPAGI